MKKYSQPDTYMHKVRVDDVLSVANVKKPNQFGEKTRNL